jgi:hypothetical protein
MDVDFGPESPYTVPLFETPLEMAEGSKRKKRMPSRFIDHLPSTSRGLSLPTTSLPHLLDHIPPTPEAPSIADPPASQFNIRQPFTTLQDAFELFRTYPDSLPTDPDDSTNVTDLCNNESLENADSNKLAPYTLPSNITDPFAPFKNASTYLLTAWVNNGSNSKSHRDVDALVRDVLLHPDFKVEDLRNFKSKQESRRLDTPSADYPNNGSNAADGWREGSVSVRLPAEDTKKRAEASSKNTKSTVFNTVRFSKLFVLHLTTLTPLHYATHRIVNTGNPTTELSRSVYMGNYTLQKCGSKRMKKFARSQSSMEWTIMSFLSCCTQTQSS